MRAAFTLGDLLNLDLGLSLIVGDADARRRPVAGAHSSEIELPAAWLDRDWILLTTGLRLQRRAGVQRALVAELAEAGAAAIGFGLGVAYEHIPNALLDEARRRDLPLFTVPLATPFRDVVRVVHRAQADTDALELQRLSAMQLQLMEALGEDVPHRAIVDRLAEMVNASVILFSSTGAVLARSGSAPAGGVWEVVRTRRPLLADVRAGNWHVVATPVTEAGGDSGWLAIVSRQPHPAGRLTRPAARATAPVLAALSRIEDAAARQDRAIRRAVLAELLDPPENAHLGELEARVSSFGVDLARGAAVVVLELPAGNEGIDLLGSWEMHSRRASLRHLCSEHRSRSVVALVQEPSDVTLAVLTAVAGDTGATAGLGRSVFEPLGVPRSLRDARLALRAAPPGGVLTFADLDLATFVAGVAPPEDVSPAADAFLAAVRDHPHLYDTLRAWFANGCDSNATAEELGLRPNSLRYRLGRIEQLLGQSLRHPKTIASLYVALAVRASAVAARHTSTTAQANI